MVYASGDRYVGAWAAGLRDGRGTLEAADGTTYMGEWKAGRRCGHGVLQAADGAVYEGEFFDDAQHGHGVCTERDGATYDGEWHGGRRNDTQPRRRTNLWLKRACRLFFGKAVGTSTTSRSSHSQ